MKKLTQSIIVTCMAFTNATQANEKYFGMALEQADYSEPGFAISGKILAFKTGLFFNSNFAIEGRFGFGLSQSSTNIDETSNGITINGRITGKVDHYLSAMAVGILPINNHLSGYGKIGVTTLSLSRSFAGTATDGVKTIFYTANGDDTGNSLSYVIGGKYTFSQDISTHAEWRSLYNREDIMIDGFVIGISKRF